MEDPAQTITITTWRESKEEVLELSSSAAHHAVNNYKTLRFCGWNSGSAVLPIQRSLVPIARFGQ